MRKPKALTRPSAPEKLATCIDRMILLYDDSFTRDPRITPFWILGDTREDPVRTADARRRRKLLHQAQRRASVVSRLLAEWNTPCIQLELMRQQFIEDDWPDPPDEWESLKAELTIRAHQLRAEGRRPASDCTLTVTDVHRMTGYSTGTVSRLCDDETLETNGKKGPERRISERSVTRLLKESPKAKIMPTRRRRRPRK